MGCPVQREARQGPLPARSRQRRTGLPGSGAPTRHPAGRRAGGHQGPRDDSVMTNATNGAEGLKARIHITLKNGVLDPQGKAIGHALEALGFQGVDEVRQGKYIEIRLNATDPKKARDQIDEMCRGMLANTVIEKYAIDLVE